MIVFQKPVDYLLSALIHFLSSLFSFYVLGSMLQLGTCKVIGIQELGFVRYFSDIVIITHLSSLCCVEACLSVVCLSVVCPENLNREIAGTIHL